MPTSSLAPYAEANEQKINSKVILASGGIIETEKGVPIITVAANGLAAAVTGISAETLVDLTTTGNTTIGDSSSDTLVVNSKFTGQLYTNETGSAQTKLKIHNHLSTAEIPGAEFKGEMLNATGEVIGVDSQWSYAPTGDTGTPTVAGAGRYHLALATGDTVTTGNLYALSGQLTNYGTFNGAAVNAAGVIGSLAGNGATTQCLHMAGVQSAISTGLVNPTTGTLSHYLANSTGTTEIDNLICMQDSQYIANFASFNLAATDRCIEASAATPAGNTSYALRILVEGTPMYIPVYDAKTF